MNECDGAGAITDGNEGSGEVIADSAFDLFVLGVIDELLVG